MQQTELSDRFQYVVERSEKRVQAINYILAALLIIVLLWALYAAWLTSKQEKITTINLVEGSQKVLGPTSLCPGDNMTIHFALNIQGTGVVVIDDSVEYANIPVKFSEAKRDYIPTSVKRTYELAWTIPPVPEMTANGRNDWAPGLYIRYITIAASNAYVSRYTEPASFRIPFTIKKDCPPVEVPNAASIAKP